jgi:hypothetical protein
LKTKEIEQKLAELLTFQKTLSAEIVLDTSVIKEQVILLVASMLE